MTSGHLHRIEEFSVSAEEARLERTKAAFSRTGSGRYVPAGTYRRLVRGRIVVMTDSPDELYDLLEFKYRCVGSVLINGLGLGCALEMALAKPSVKDVTVIEKEQEVIDLVAPQFRDSRLAIHCADAFTWQPPAGKRWNVIWHDIWDNICVGNLPQMTRLHRKYGRKCDWQGSWAKEFCKMVTQ
jgi:hypothetical protein